VAERAIEAPTYVEPGAEGDALGVEGRHRNNMGKLFGYLVHLAKVVINHADMADNSDFEQRVAKRAAREKLLEMKATKDMLHKGSKELQLVAGIVQANDQKLKTDMEQSAKGVLGLLGG